MKSRKTAHWKTEFNLQFISLPSNHEYNASFIIVCQVLKEVLFLAPLGPCQHGQRDVFRPARSRWLRRLLQPAGRPRPLLHHRLQLLRGDARRDVSRHAEGHPVPAAGAASAPRVEPLPSHTSSSTREKKHFIVLSLDEARFSWHECFCDASLERWNLIPLLRTECSVSEGLFFFFFSLIEAANPFLSSNCCIRR